MKLIQEMVKNFNSKFLNGLKAPENSVIETIKILENKGIGKKKINFRLKDWGFSSKVLGMSNSYYI